MKIGQSIYAVAERLTAYLIDVPKDERLKLRFRNGGDLIGR